MKLTFKNYHLRHLVEWLGVPVHGEEARARNKLFRQIMPHVNDMEAKRLDYLKNAAEKDAKGNPKVKPPSSVTGQAEFDLSETNMAAFNEWIRSVNEEEVEVVIDSLVAKALLKKLGELKTFSPQEGQIYDEICETFEK